MAIEVFDRAALELLNPEEAIQHIAEGFKFTEGPVWDAVHNRLIFSDIPANTSHSYADEAGVAIFRQPSNFSNGLILDRARRLLACEHHTRRVTRTVSALEDTDGSIEVLASHYQGKRLNSPNDLVEAADGSIIFTDPTYGLRPEEGGDGEQEQPCQGVYRIVPGQAEPVLLVDDFIQPNGLALSQDGGTLYVDDSVGGHIRAFTVNDDGSLSGGAVLVDFGDEIIEAEGAPDGMKLDALGNIYCTGPAGVWIANPNGLMLAHVVPPEVPANVAWGDADRQTLYMTARTGLYRLRFLVAGQQYQTG